MRRPYRKHRMVAFRLADYLDDDRTPEDIAKGFRDHQLCLTEYPPNRASRSSRPNELRRSTAQKNRPAPPPPEFTESEDESQTEKSSLTEIPATTPSTATSPAKPLEENKETEKERISTLRAGIRLFKLFLEQSDQKLLEQCPADAIHKNQALVVRPIRRSTLLNGRRPGRVPMLKRPLKSPRKIRSVIVKPNRVDSNSPSS